MLLYFFKNKKNNNIMLIPIYFFTAIIAKVLLKPERIRFCVTILSTKKVKTLLQLLLTINFISHH